MAGYLTVISDAELNKLTKVHDFHNSAKLGDTSNMIEGLLQAHTIFKS